MGRKGRGITALIPPTSDCLSIRILEVQCLIHGGAKLPVDDKVLVGCGLPVPVVFLHGRHPLLNRCSEGEPPTSGGAIASLLRRMMASREK
ncbi:hypothetical protein B840_12530 (plasmid) [Corynebacterium marinum DSM 44953]|uniref:Uncharacterized protein n=1 Tax=Corynebacterium marinum DSM 44953 TaxID=1224162 RepID=A0A0B6TUV8_9CORY|nr:hypothetical protein B840_12530 [Corynebacterium marinum DSM 44953]